MVMKVAKEQRVKVQIDLRAEEEGKFRELPATQFLASKRVLKTQTNYNSKDFQLLVVIFYLPNTPYATYAADGYTTLNRRQQPY